MNNKQLADKLTTELTGILNYVVTDDVQLFSKDMKLGGDEYVPAVLSTITSFENENRYVRNVTYELMFRVRNELRDSFYADIDAFKASQTTETIGSYFVTKVVESLIKADKTTIKGVGYFDYTVEMRWTWALSKVGTSTTIKVDTVAIPFISCDVVHDISYVSNQAADSGYRLTNDTVILIVPLILANTKIAALYTAAGTHAYNQTYALDIDGQAKTVVLKRTQYVFTNTTTVTNMIMTFETHYPRVTVEIDGDAIPVTAYMYQGRKVFEMSARDNDVQKGYATSKVRTWSVTLVNDGSTAWNKLEADAYGDSTGVTYTLDIGLATNFTVELGDVTERYTETGDMTLECQFIEVET